MGFYVWYRLSSFPKDNLTQLLDMIGRRPVILAGTVGLALSTILFGLSQNFQSALAARALGTTKDVQNSVSDTILLAGLFSGNVAVIPSVLCEITDRSNQSFVFPFFGLWWPIGAIIGYAMSCLRFSASITYVRPLVGGAFSNPATRYPHLFDYDFFRTYPYFLPCFVVFSITAACIFFSFIFLEEVSVQSSRALVFRCSTELDEEPSKKTSAGHDHDHDVQRSLPEQTRWNLPTSEHPRVILCANDPRYLSIWVCIELHFNFV